MAIDLHDNKLILLLAEMGDSFLVKISPNYCCLAEGQVSKREKLFCLNLTVPVPSHFEGWIAARPLDIKSLVSKAGITQLG